MCDLNSKIEGEVRGWKIVAIKDREYYSVAMGFKYEEDEDIPIVLEQRGLSDHFNCNILNIYAHMGFRKEMIGRTSIFQNYEDAEKLFHNILRLGERIKLSIVQASVSKDVLGGTYKDLRVFAGRRIKFIK